MALSSEVGSFSNGSTGNTTISLSGVFTPTRIKFWCGARSGTTETASLSSFGHVDVGNSISTAQSNFGDGTGHQTKNTTASCLIHYARVTGTITKVIDMTFVSAAAGAFTVNLGTANANYPVYFEAMA